jgi:hypothetical protein
VSRRTSQSIASMRARWRASQRPAGFQVPMRMVAVWRLCCRTTSAPWLRHARSSLLNQGREIRGEEAEAPTHGVAPSTGTVRSTEQAWTAEQALAWSAMTVKQRGAPAMRRRRRGLWCRSRRSRFDAPSQARESRHGPAADPDCSSTTNPTSTDAPRAVHAALPVEEYRLAQPMFAQWTYPQRRQT